MNNEMKVLKLEEEIKELKNQLIMKSNKINELEYALEQQKPKAIESDMNAQRIVQSLLNHEPEEFLITLDNLLTSFMCFDPAADDSKERNEKVYCVNALKYHINKVLVFQQALDGKD